MTDKVFVLDVFHLSIGLSAVMIFPENKTPQIGMCLQRQDNARWKIISLSRPKMSNMTNAYCSMNPPALIWTCLLEGQANDEILKKGDEFIL